MDRTVRILGAPMDLGADRRGVDMGPSAIRYAGLADELETLGISCTDAGDIPVPHPEEPDSLSTQLGGGSAKFLDETADVSRSLTKAVTGAVSDGAFPLVLGGDHTVAIGTAAGLSQDVGVLWFDAHGDYNLPRSSPTGNLHGMALSAILGDGPFADLGWARAASIDPENVVWIGLRDLDPGERERVRESAATAYSISALDRRGVADVVAEALDTALEGVEGLYVSLDMDWLDPTEAPGVGTPVRGGVSYREAHVAMELVSSRAGEALVAMDLVEVNPILDQHNRTAELGCELVASAFGRRVL